MKSIRKRGNSPALLFQKRAGSSRVFLSVPSVFFSEFLRSQRGGYPPPLTCLNDVRHKTFSPIKIKRPKGGATVQHPVAIRSESAEELAVLYKEAGHGLTDEEMSRTQVPLERLEVAPEAFQFRMQHDRSGETERHLRRLVQALKRQDGYLDPLLLFALDSRRIVLDGHCRLLAYLRADLEPSTEVPVRYFQGAFSEALTRPALENSKVKLGLLSRSGSRPPGRS